jgi:hypothetical protein
VKICSDNRRGAGENLESEENESLGSVNLEKLTVEPQNAFALKRPTLFWRKLTMILIQAAILLLIE